VTRCLLAVLVAVALSACSGRSNPSAPAAPPAQVAGLWTASMTVTGGTEMAAGSQYGAMFTLSQSAAQIGGSFSASGPGVAIWGGIVGTMTGSGFRFTLSQISPCPATFTGSGTVSANDSTLMGSYSGTDCGGTVSTALVATRE